MKIRDAVDRAVRGLSDNLRHYLLATLSLAIAFLCLGFALLGVENLTHLEKRWAGDRRLSVYLEESASADAITQLRLVLGSLEEVSEVEYISPAATKALFTADSALADLTTELPDDTFPGSLELRLGSAASPERIAELSARIVGLNAVAEVDTYASWFSRLQHIMFLGRSLTLALTLLVALCVVAVIANSIRLSLITRSKEIEIMRLCGATELFVRAPFVLEGAMQGAMAALLALGMLSAGYALSYGHVHALTSAALGIAPAFLGPVPFTMLMLLGLLGGSFGSAWTLYRLDTQEEA